MGGVMFVMGGGVQGGRVYGTYPGLKTDSLIGPGYLPVTTNYWGVLIPVLERYGAGSDLAAIFPDFDRHPTKVKDRV